MKQLIKYIAEAIVDDSENVQVTEVEGEGLTIVQLRVMKNDIGKVIGKQGRMAQCLRVILGAYAAKNKRRAVLEIVG